MFVKWAADQPLHDLLCMRPLPPAIPHERLDSFHVAKSRGAHTSQQGAQVVCNGDADVPMFHRALLPIDTQDSSGASLRLTSLTQTGKRISNT